MPTLNIENLKIDNITCEATFDYAGNHYAYDLKYQELVVMENGEAILSGDEDDVLLNVDLDQDWDNEKTIVKLHNAYGAFSFSFECQ